MNDGLTLELFWDAWELFEHPTLAGTYAGALLGWLGVFIVSRRMVFLSAALSQTAGLGVVLAFYAQIHFAWSGVLVEPLTGATLLTLLVVLLVFSDRSHLGHRRDGLLGLAFLVGAAGTLILATRVTQELHDVQTLIFGSAVAILPEDFKTFTTMAVAVGAIQLLGRRGFAAVTFDRDDATIRGLPTGLLELVLLVSLAVAISTATRILGALPAFAFSVLPAMAALRLSPNLGWALWLAAAFGAAAGFLGYLLAFLKSYPVGASQALVGVAFLALAELLRLLWRAGGRIKALATSAVP